MAADIARGSGPVMPTVTERAPVIVLACPDSGGSWLLSLLSASGELACTSGTGVLPLCDQATQVWRRVENGSPQAGRPSALAAKSIRASIAPLVMHILASSGAQRWCECAVPAREAAEAFLGLFPGTRFVCLHREASQVIRAALARSPWGLAGQAYRPFIAAQPGSTVAALAAYWIAHTEALLAFEADHPDRCLRVRFEDLPGAMGTIPTALSSFLGLTANRYISPPGPREDDRSVPDADVPPSAAMPLEQLSSAVLAQVNGLLGQLGYPSLAPG
ncbi:MAG: sulfotransferase [Streptosporangiaceae bacterium]|jgi:protein-tyrosine sulfotransferase